MLANMKNNKFHVKYTMIRQKLPNIFHPVQRDISCVIYWNLYVAL